MFELTRENGEQMLLGGWFLGGGGGGLPEGGREILDLVLKTGPVRFVSLDELKEEDLLVTASLVGSPASPDSCVQERHYQQVYDSFLAADDRRIAAFVTNENGGHSITNGWMVAALTGKPMVDAACNGRAHPTGVMGAMGLHALPGYQSVQTAAGGKGSSEIALTVTGTVEQTSAAVRNAATLAGGYVTVLRTRQQQDTSVKTAPWAVSPRPWRWAVSGSRIWTMRTNCWPRWPIFWTAGCWAGAGSPTWHSKSAAALMWAWCRWTPTRAPWKWTL